MAHLLGIDVGTGGSKALLIDDAGTVVASATTEYPLLTPRPQWAEQDPAAWWSATVASTRRVLDESGIDPASIAGIGLTGQMHGLVLLDASGGVLRPAILWNDQRTAAQCRAIHARLGEDAVIRITGKPALTGFTAPKLLWVREHEPQVWAAAAQILLPKDYVRFRLTGEFLMDVADGSGTSLLDVNTRAWSDEILDALEIPHAWLPPLAESAVAGAPVHADAGRQTGLAPGTPVVAGAGDQAAQAVGCGIVDARSPVSVTLGTSGVVFAATDGCRVDPTGALHAFCHAVPGACHLMGVMLSAGGSFKWYRDTLRPGADYDALTSEANAVPAGCEGLAFLPYLTGERTPHPDPDARGAFVGLTLRHGPAHLTRAVMEGVTFGLRDGLELMRGMGVGATRVRVSGGGAASSVWRQMMADVFEAEVATVNVTEGAAYGAALLAGVGAGVWADVAGAARSTVVESDVTAPGANAKASAHAYEAFRGLYPALASSFRRLGG
ncbi:MAG: xylulokinase [Planctomycetes bacterium]|nr:xylulokinase [Planctomycetota bacterium]